MLHGVCGEALDERVEAVAHLEGDVAAVVREHCDRWGQAAESMRWWRRGKRHLYQSRREAALFCQVEDVHNTAVANNGGARAERLDFFEHVR
jgi:hypothetical protein